MKIRLGALCRHRGNQSILSMYRHHSLQVIRQDMQVHFCADIFQLLRQKMSGPIQHLIVPKGCSTVCFLMSIL